MPAGHVSGTIRSRWTRCLPCCQCEHETAGSFVRHLLQVTESGRRKEKGGAGDGLSPAPPFPRIVKLTPRAQLLSSCDLEEGPGSSLGFLDPDLQQTRRRHTRALI